MLSGKWFHDICDKYILHEILIDPNRSYRTRAGPVHSSFS